MSLTIQPEIFERFPNMQIIGLVASGLNNEVARPEVTKLWQASWQAVSQLFSPEDNVQSHPRIKAWRECFRAMGVSNKEYPSAIEALVRRAKKGANPFYINPLVDYYNAISLRHIVPLGGFDLLDLNAPLEARLTRKGDTFRALDAQMVVAVEPGEVAYTSGQVVLARHLMWRQAKTGLITPTTRSVVLVGEVMEEPGLDLAKIVLTDLVAGLTQIFGVEVLPFILEKNANYIQW